MRLKETKDVVIMTKINLRLTKKYGHNDQNR